MKKFKPKYRIIYKPFKPVTVWDVMRSYVDGDKPYVLQEKGWLFWNDTARRETFEKAQQRMYQLIGEKQLAQEPPAEFSARGWRIRA